MILFIESHAGHRQHYVIQSASDLAPFFHKFPRTKDIFMHSADLHEAVVSIAEYLNTGFSHAWVEHGGLSKSLRNKAIALGLAASSLVIPSVGAKQQLHPVEPLKPKITATQDFGKHPEDRFLWTISQIESSGGKNIEHAQIQHGKYRGERAIGKWGLLPPTVKDVLTRLHAAGKSTPELQHLGHMGRDQLDRFFQQNPHHELTVARTLARHVLRRNKGDMHRAAYSWLMGHNLHPESISDQSLHQSDYVHKFKQFDVANPLKNKIKTAKMKSSIVKKSEESPEDFKMRVKNWKKTRDESYHSLLPPASYSPDPGRLRDPELDKKPPQPSTLESLKDSFKGYKNEN